MRRQTVTQAITCSLGPSDEELALYLTNPYCFDYSHPIPSESSRLGGSATDTFFARRSFLTSGCDTWSRSVILHICSDELLSCPCQDFLTSIRKVVWQEVALHLNGSWSYFLLSISQKTDLGCVEVALHFDVGRVHCLNYEVCLLLSRTRTADCKT